MCETCHGAGRINGKYNDDKQWIFDLCPTCEGKRLIDLTLRTSVSEVDYKNKIGKENWDMLVFITKSYANFKCESCNYTPKDDELRHTDLFTHVVTENVNDPLNTHTICLCKACHVTQHIDVAIAKSWVDLVNAKYSQGQITNMCRGAGMGTGLLDAIEKGEIQELKKTPEEFLTEYTSGVINYDNRLKVKFRVNNFHFEI